jgi:ABC-type molybdenum transport system ATPase subunit/photorepair protein PhrA
VDYGGAAALREVDWEVLPGEGWAVSGPNGAGKSTLLKLILGDVQPLPGGRVRRFGQTARSGRMSIWEIKQRIGSVSAEFQARYAQAATAEEVVLSGLEASIGVYREFSAEERDLARRWLEFFGLAEVAGVELARLSNGQQRRALLARAMMTGPELLLLDEPCAGLDAESRRELLGFLVRLRTLGTAVVYVTHHPGEVAGLGLRELRLERGRVVGNSADERAGASGAKAQGGGA